MFQRVNELLIEVPPPSRQDPNAAAVLRELQGDARRLCVERQFSSKSKLRPFYRLVAGITMEELDQVELMGNGRRMLNNGPFQQGRNEGIPSAFTPDYASEEKLGIAINKPAILRQRRRM